jgi:hypothetical protein
MEENGNKSYPVRTLTVENFSVIKYAKLEFGKMTVLIGPQSSGKSLLCKLAYFLSKQTLDHAVAAILTRDTFQDLKHRITKELISRFLIGTWQRQDARVSFESLGYSIKVYPKLRPGEIEINIEFSAQFEELFERLVAQMASLPTTGSESRRFLASQVRTQLDLMLNGGYVYDSVYFPSGRAFFLNQAMGFNALSNPNIDPIVRDFSLELRLGEPWDPNPIAEEKALRALEEIRREMIRLAGGFIEGRDVSLRFRRLLDEKEIPLAYLSSGVQELLPLFNVLRQMAARQRDRIVFPRKDNLPGMPDQIILSKGQAYIEEPEANVFPSTQFDLVRLFARLSAEPSLDFSFVITTHSPYILTAFNTLIEAWRAGNKEDKREQVSAVIPERFWVNEDDFAAYAIRDGVLTQIFQKETDGVEGSGLIDGDYLDSVSDEIGGQFEKLLDIEYAK